MAGGTPTLTLNDGGTATYSGGSGSSALTFSYTVAAGQNTPDLAVTAVNLGTATVTDAAGNAAVLTGAVTNPGGTLQIDTTAPRVSSLTESPSSGDLDAGKTVTLTLNLSEAVTVAGARRRCAQRWRHSDLQRRFRHRCAELQLHGGGGQNTAGLMATAVNLNSATVNDGAGNAANLSLTGLTQRGAQIDTTPPAAPAITRTLIIATIPSSSVVPPRPTVR